MSGVLQARELAVEVAGRTVVAGASFSLRAGDKVGLVGRNGAGKTSLLQVLAGSEQPASGVVLRRGRLGHVTQDARPPATATGATAITRILSGRGLDEQAEALERLRQAVESDPTEKNVARYSRAEDAFRVAGGYWGESEARRIAAGLGLPATRLDLPLRSLSGGERRRVELGRVLFMDADLLFLDEPTNHLDTDAKSWLMNFLRSYRGGLLVVSHDLHLLDAAITRILHLDETRLVEYKGTYSQYRAARKRDEENLARTAVRQESEIKRLQDLADSMRHQTSKRARTAKSLDKRVERLKVEKVAAPARERKTRFRFPEPPHSGRLLVAVEDLAKGYGGPLVFRKIGFELERGGRLLVLGLNGAGKTSLLRILAGVTAADAGAVRFGTGVSVGYYAQEHEGIERGRSVLEHMRRASDAPEPQLRAILGTFGLVGEVAFQDAGTLSGGEKTKLALAQLVAGRHNLLLLDEPTNNLDPPSREGVAKALAAWPGGIVLVSHDTEFVSALGPERVLMMPEGKLDYFGDDYVELVALA
jgi:ATPase subunit of ABC transporter with duplicated ATPase domains